MARIQKREKLVGQDAIRAAQLGFRPTYAVSERRFALSTARYGIRTPSSAHKQERLTTW